ncbi:MAG: GNAT family N-acetyltransferase, partial [Deltaproteobacteria bacterium]|nr:GNAT family N-acetyltransferase [Deltaproteobacteria bacterium]
CELRKMYLDSAMRGRGLGKRLLEHALSRARELGFRVVELETAAPLESAIALYQRYGFRPLEEAPSTPRCDQMMVLDL